MSTFKKYPKVHRLGKEETDGILLGSCHIQEKLDGANASIWISENGIACGSRNNTLTKDVDNHVEEKTFNGFVDYVKENKEIRELLKDHPTYRLYGEWLVRHTIQYNETALKKFYLFDITETLDGEEVEAFFPIEKVNEIADQYKVPRPQYFGLIKNPQLDELSEFVGKSELGEHGEGIVIKNPEFRDKWENHNYGKVVTEKFKENNAVTFGGNNKHSDTYWEMYIVNKYITLGRVKKVMEKIQPFIEERLHLQHIPRVMESTYYDMISEEIYEIQKKVPKVDFKVLRRIASAKTKKIYMEILSGDISVAHK